MQSELENCMNNKDLMKVNRKSYGYSLIDVKPKAESYFAKHSFPRGLCYIKKNDSLVHTVVGFPKFYSNELSEADLFLFTKKENGECAHLSFFYDEEWYAVVGSKTVHLLLRTNEIEKEYKELYSSFSKDTRYTTLLSIANDLVRDCAFLFKEEVMSKVYEKRLTIVFESTRNDSVHFFSYEKNTLFGLGATSPYEKAFIVNPEESFSLLREIGIQTVECAYFNPVEGTEMYRNNENCEGSVVYCIKNSKVVSIHKVKSIFYMLMRSARTSIVNKHNEQLFMKNLDDVIRQEAEFFSKTVEIESKECDRSVLESRIKGMNERYASFKQELLRFNAWVIVNNYPLKMDFLTPYRLFKESSQTIDTESVIRNYTNFSILIALRGIPGSGKSTFACALKKIYSDCQLFNQDVIGTATKFYAEIKKAVETKTSLIIADKCNQLSRHLDFLMELPLRKFFVFEFSISPDLSLKRIQERGSAHRTLYYTEDKSLEAILNAFSTKFYSYPADLVFEEEEGDRIQRAVEFIEKSTLGVLKKSIPLPPEEDKELSRNFYKALYEESKASYKLETLSFVLSNENCYVYLQLNKNDVLALANEIEECRSFTLKNEFHVTLCYKRPYDRERFLEVENSAIEVKIESFVYSNEFCAFKVSNLKELYASNYIPHVTLAVNGIKPGEVGDFILNRENTEIKKERSIYGKIECRMIGNKTNVTF